MKQANQSMVPYFIIKGITEEPKLQAPVFVLVLLIYVITLGGNMTILHLVCHDRQLHTPMYFFLGNLSLMDISYTTVTVNRVLVNFISGDHTISVSACFAQFFIYASLTVDELLILAAMSYDRYVAICNPLYYHMTMSRTVCALLAADSWVLGFLENTSYIILFSRITCYRSNIINHFLCDFVPLIKLFCSDTSLLKTLVFTEALFISFLTPFILTFISYVYIIVTILRIRSSSGRRKAFYTCSSHLTVVILLYMTLFCQYMIPPTKDTSDSNTIFTLLNTAVVPLLNPLIYSLKNKDVKSALRRRLRNPKAQT